MHINICLCQNPWSLQFIIEKTTCFFCFVAEQTFFKLPLSFSVTQAHNRPGLVWPSPCFAPIPFSWLAWTTYSAYYERRQQIILLTAPKFSLYRLNPTNTAPRDKRQSWQKRQKEKRDRVRSIENRSKMKRGKGEDEEGIKKKEKEKGEEYRHGAKGRGSTTKAPNPLNDCVLSGNKDQLTAAATYQHSDRECKLALMQMSLVFRGKTDCLYTNPPKHKTLLCAIRSPPTLLQSCTESHSQQHLKETILCRARGVSSQETRSSSLHKCTQTHFRKR